jgi:hypothetical protein
MVNTKDVDEYLASWEQFKEYCDKKAKDRCKLNSYSWHKLSEFHLEEYLKKIESPFGFLFRAKMFRPDVFKQRSEMRRMYYKCLYDRQKSFIGNIEERGME